MEHNLLEMYERGRTTPLSAEEAAWLKGQTAQHPYFALPYQMLALYHQQMETLQAAEALTLAAGVSPNRALLKRYLLGAPTVTLSSKPQPEKPVPPLPPVQEAEAPKAMEPAETLPLVTEEPAADPMPKAEQPEAQEALPKEEPVVSETPAKPVAKPAEAGINWGLHTRITFRTSQYLKLSAKLLSQLSLTEGEWRLKDAEEASQKETSLVEEPVLSHPQELPAVEPAPEEIIVEEPVLALPVKEEEVVAAPEKEQPVEEPVAEQLAEPVISIASEEAHEAQPKQEEPQDEARLEETPAPEVLADDLPPAVEEPAAELEQPSTPEEYDGDELPPLDEEETSMVRPFEFTSTGLGLSRKLTHVAAAPEKEALEEAEAPTPYKIGAFSSFSFLEGEGTDKLPAAEALKSDQPQLLGQTPAGNGIVLEERGRRVEIVVTPEQLELLFDKHKILPVLQEQPQEKTPEAQTPEAQTEPEAQDQEEAPAPKRKADDIIDKFIEAEPSISRPTKKQAPGDDLGRDYVKEKEELVTETLAWIHARQGNTHRAIKMYEKLKLRFPQKSDYFADLISKLKK